MRVGVLRFADLGGGCPRPFCDDPELTSQLALQIVSAASPSFDGLDAVLVDGYAEPDPHRRAIDALREFASAGAPVLGMCGGFHLFCDVGLLEGSYEPHAQPREDGDLGLRRSRTGTGPQEQQFFCLIEGRPTPFTHAIPAGRHVPVNVPQAAGRYHHPDPEGLARRGQVVLRYCTFDGEVALEANPGGSDDNIAGVCNADGNVVGIAAHPPAALYRSAMAYKIGSPARV